ncbi:hypothetical protein AVEN_43977-1 [Araneus ventricosus]|uniref:Uncharacterized protein n=1 Tax=Araneus ventricosus TaxID=182803 RepID=A0A4Y2T7Y1_ARAVE|nr:hypothetical protein AVEN_43977-1 [Araneus ventricosus]
MHTHLLPTRRGEHVNEVGLKEAIRFQNAHTSFLPTRRGEIICERAGSKGSHTVPKMHTHLSSPMTRRNYVNEVGSKKPYETKCTHIFLPYQTRRNYERGRFKGLLRFRKCTPSFFTTRRGEIGERGRLKGSHI